MRGWYRARIPGINHPGTAKKTMVKRASTLGLVTRLVLAVLVGGAWSLRSAAQGAPERAEGILALVVDHLRAHPFVRGPIVLTRYERALGRTTWERGTLAMAPTGFRSTIGHVEVRAERDVLEVLDGTVRPASLLILGGRTLLALYGDVVDGADIASLAAIRLLRAAPSRAVVEIVPRAPWPGIERLVAEVDLSSAPGRVTRALWLDGLGNWVRVDLRAVSYPTGIEASAFSPLERRGAVRVEL